MGQLSEAINKIRSAIEEIKQLHSDILTSVQNHSQFPSVWGLSSGSDCEKEKDDVIQYPCHLAWSRLVYLLLYRDLVH